MLLVAAFGVTFNACAPTTIVRGGDGDALTPPFHVERGTYLIHWVAQDPRVTKHGCLFGLAIEVVRSGVADPRDLPTWFSQKLVYQTIDVGAELVGDAGGLLLPTGSYLLRAEGNCTWRAEVLPGNITATPTPEGVEEGS
jgi:hypothetical protein